ncbi:MAG: zf-HC2 domain-containing protein [Proteobacteria bacterium]|nr:zf-HC2 domain-containing protein [Pseudomonadota bacterium]
MQCTEAHTLFTGFADNTLARLELHALTDHLLGCQGCALEWREFHQTLDLMHSLETQAPPPDLLPGIHAKLAKKGTFSRAWDCVESLNFSLSIPAAAAIFTIAMIAGFLLKPSPMEQPTIFQTRSTRTGTLHQGEITTTRRPPIGASNMFAVSHNGTPQDMSLMPLAQTALATHLPPDNDAPRLLSPDMHVLIENIEQDQQAELFREMSSRNWHLHRISASLFLVHLPQTELEFFHELLSRYHFALMPTGASDARFGSDKEVLTAAIRFQ